MWAIRLGGEGRVARGASIRGVGDWSIRNFNDLASFVSHPALAPGQEAGQRLLKRGWSERRTRRFLGENLPRVFGKTGTP
jgi:hypothetical protein